MAKLTTTWTVSDETSARREDWQGTFQYDLSGKLEPGPGPIQAVSTGQGTAIDTSVTSAVGDLGVMIVVNDDATNSVQIGSDNGGNIEVFALLAPGQSCVFPADPTVTYRARGVSGTAVIAALCFLGD